jgi:hypothetical protein
LTIRLLDVGLGLGLDVLEGLDLGLIIGSGLGSGLGIVLGLVLGIVLGLCLYLVVKHDIQNSWSQNIVISSEDCMSLFNGEI